MLSWSLLIVIALLCAGCTGFEKAMLALHNADISSCQKLDITGAAGYGGGVSGHGVVIIATGEATMTDCVKLFSGF